MLGTIHIVSKKYPDTISILSRYFDQMDSVIKDFIYIISLIFRYDGVSPGRTPDGNGPSAAGSVNLSNALVISNLPRRESFLYRSDSDFDTHSPKSTSRHSSIASDIG